MYLLLSKVPKGWYCAAIVLLNLNENKIMKSYLYDFKCLFVSKWLDLQNLDLRTSNINGI